MDITHDNVCSSMLSCFYSHLLSTGRPISSFYCFILITIKHISLKKFFNDLKKLVLAKEKNLVKRLTIKGV